MGRAPCCDKANVKKGPWSPEEDEKLKSYIENHGTGGNWITLPHKIGLKRCGKSCRLRWLNYLRPNIKHGGFSDEEDSIICSLYIAIGSRWSIIAAQLPGRTDNDIKNHWNTKLKTMLLGAKHRGRKINYQNRGGGGGACNINYHMHAAMINYNAAADHMQQPAANAHQALVLPASAHDSIHIGAHHQMQLIKLAAADHHHLISCRFPFYESTTPGGGAHQAQLLVAPSFTIPQLPSIHDQYQPAADPPTPAFSWIHETPIFTDALPQQPQTWTPNHVFTPPHDHHEELGYYGMKLQQQEARDDQLLPWNGIEWVVGGGLLH